MSLPSITIPSAHANEPRTGYYCPECHQTTFPPYPHKVGSAWHYPASGGGFYLITHMFGEAYECSCPSFHFRGRCKHLSSEEGVYAMEERAKRAEKASAGRGVKLEDLY